MNRNLMQVAVCMLAGASIMAIPGIALSAENMVMEEVFVTGSRIERSQFESSSPVSVYSAQDLSNSSAMSIDEFLMKAPEFSGYALGTATNNGNNGAKMIDLRGLGHKRTLILINGRRQVGSFVGGSLDLGAVDLNTVPMAMVERIEVLKDGASTAYGSDAIAGVVNIILKKRFDGVEVSGNFGYGTEHWDARNDGVALTMGVTNDKGAMTLGLEYANQEELIQSERKWGEYTLWPVRNAQGVFELQRQGSSNSRKIKGLSDAARAQIAASMGVGDAPITYIVDAQTGAARPFNSNTDTYNYAPVNALATPNERWQLTALGDRELLSNSTVGVVRAHGEINYTKRMSHQLLAPDASFSTNTLNGLANEFVPASNPFNPFGDTPNNPWGVSGEGVRVNRRFTESGGRLFSQNVDTYRMVAGFNGEINDYLNWDLSYVYADNQEVYETRFYHRFDRWQTMVDPARCSANPDCVAATGPENALNPFQPYGGISKKELNYLMANSLKDIYETTMTNLSLNLNGSFGSLPGGSIGWAAGVEQRREEARIIPDEFSANGLTTGGALAPLKGEYNVDEFYVEVLLPVLADVPFVQSLNLEASARYSDYDTSAGSTNNYRFGVDWAINNAVRVRTVYSTGFRAPNMVEYFTQADTNPITENWCEFWGERNDINATAKTNCAALGYASNYQQEFQYQSTYTQLASSDNLGPEESTTWTAGVVWTPAFAEGLQFSVDWYAIEIDDYISLPEYNFMVKACLESVNFSSPACSAFPQGRGVSDSGDKSFGGVTEDAKVSLGNLGTVKTSGADLAVSYSIPVAWGVINTVDLNLSSAYLNKFEKAFNVTGTIDYVGTAGGDYGVAVYPEWRHNTSVKLAANNWSVSWYMRWIDEARDLYRPAPLSDDAKAESVLYHDLVANYSYDRLTVTLGIDNVTDEEPPVFHSGFNMRTAPGVYDTIGQRVWMGVSLAFD